MEVLNERGNFDLTNFSWLFCSYQHFHSLVELFGRRHKKTPKQQIKLVDCHCCHRTIISHSHLIQFHYSIFPASVGFASHVENKNTTRNQLSVDERVIRFIHDFHSIQLMTRERNRINFQLNQRKWNFCVSNSIFSIFFTFFVIFKISEIFQNFLFLLIILTSTILHVSTSNNPPALNEISTKFSYSIWSLSSTFPSIRLVGSVITCALDCFLLLWTFLIRTKSAQLSWWCWGSGKVNSLNNKCFSIFFFFCFCRINCYFMHMRRNNPSHLPWVLSTAHVLILNLCELS